MARGQLCEVEGICFMPVLCLVTFPSSVRLHCGKCSFARSLRHPTNIYPVYALSGIRMNAVFKRCVSLKIPFLHPRPCQASEGVLL